jgi:hypothetical protein
MTTRSASDLEKFLVYARVFEMAYWADAWDGLGPHLTDDAVHVVHAASPLGLDDRGRDAVIAGLKESVLGMDRRFDVRIPEVLDGPRARADGVWMRFALTLRHPGLPDLRIEGDHLVRFEAGRLARIEETLEPGAGERVAAFLAEHDAKLRPVGSPAAPPTDPRDVRDLEDAMLRTLVRSYGNAKSQQDIGAAFATCSEDFVLETVAMEIEARGRAEVEAQLEMFFTAFPDYGVTLDGLATGDGAVTCWGRARMTWRGEFFGHAPTGRTAELPFFCVFPSSGGVLRGERFFFDLASLCDQIGLPLAVVRGLLDQIRGVETRGAA